MCPLGSDENNVSVLLVQMEPKSLSFCLPVSLGNSLGSWLLAFLFMFSDTSIVFSGKINELR